MQAQLNSICKDGRQVMLCLLVFVHALALSRFKCATQTQMDMQAQRQGKICVNWGNANVNASATTRNERFFIPCACIWTCVAWVLTYFSLRLRLHLHRMCEPSLRIFLVPSGWDTSLLQGSSKH